MFGRWFVKVLSATDLSIITNTDKKCLTLSNKSATWSQIKTCSYYRGELEIKCPFRMKIERSVGYIEQIAEETVALHFNQLQ